MLPAEPGDQELRWRLVAEGRMRPFSVVKDLNVFKGRSIDRSVCSVAKAMDPLVFEAVEPALRRRVIPAVPFPAHRASHAVFLELALKGMTGVLASPVGVVQQPRRWFLAEPGHGQRGHDVRRHARLERPADDFAVEQVEHDGQVEPAFIRPQISHVRRPDLIRRRRGKVSGEQVLRYRQTMLRVRRDLVAPLVAGVDPVVAHHSFDPFLAGREASGTQLAHHARAAVGPFEFAMNQADQGQHLAVRQALAIRLAATLPGPIAADADVEHVAHFGQGKRISLFGNPGVLHRTSLADALAILDPLDRQFLELGRVCLLRYLHFLPSIRDSTLCHPWQTKFRGKLSRRSTAL